MSSTPEWNATIELRGTRVALRPPNEVELEASSRGVRGRLIGALKSVAEWPVLPGGHLRRMRRRAASVIAPEFCGLARELHVWECVLVWQSFQGAFAAWSAEILRRAHEETASAYAAGRPDSPQSRRGRREEAGSGSAPSPTPRQPQAASRSRGAMIEFGPNDPKPQWAASGVMKNNLSMEGERRG